MTDSPDTDPDDALGHLRTARGQIFSEYAEVESALDALHARRHHLAAALEQLDQLIAQLGCEVPTTDGGYDVALVASDGEYVAGFESKRSNTFDASEGSTREAILYLLESEPRLFETHEIVEGVQRLGVDSRAATTRSLLSKLAGARKIERVRRGLYREIRVHSRDGRLVKANSRTPYNVVEKPTPEEFMKTTGGTTSPDSHAAEFDGPVSAEYTQLNFDGAHAAPAGQPDREETSS